LVVPRCSLLVVDLEKEDSRRRNPSWAPVVRPPFLGNRNEVPLTFFGRFPVLIGSSFLDRASHGVQMSTPQKTAVALARREGKYHLPIHVEYC
jgi:hypothetical protein